MIGNHHALLMLAAVAAFIVAPASVRAGDLAAPQNVTCDVVNDVIEVDWDDVVGATKYSVGVLAAYDTTGDGEPDEFVEFDFGTSDRTDGGAIGDSDLGVPLEDLVLGVDTDGDQVADTFFDPVAVVVRVKALHPGRGQGAQNGEWSEDCVVALP